MVADTGGHVLALALSHVPLDALPMSALLSVLHPDLTPVDLAWPPPWAAPGAAAGADAAGTGAGAQAGAAAAAAGAAAGRPDAAPSSGDGPGEAPGRDPDASSSRSGEVSTSGVSGGSVEAQGSSATPPAAPRARRLSFPLLRVGCDPAARSLILLDGVPLQREPATPLLRHEMRAA